MGGDQPIQHRGRLGFKRVSRGRSGAPEGDVEFRALEIPSCSNRLLRRALAALALIGYAVTGDARYVRLPGRKRSIPNAPASQSERGKPDKCMGEAKGMTCCGSALKEWADQ